MKNILTEEQCAVLQSNEAQNFILAGAGCGKTTLLAEVVRRHVNDKTVAFTFTRKAATEMTSKLTEDGQSIPSNVIISTFHAFAFANVKKSNPSVVLSDDDNGLDIVKSIVKRLSLDVKPKAVFEEIKWSKNKNVDYLCHDDVMSKDDFKTVFDEYNKILKESNYMDFEDIIIEASKLDYDFDVVLVDEFQDINQIEIDYIKALTKKASKTYIFGDDSQSIYGWRGADNNFELVKDYKVFRLTKNYRSPQNIIDEAAKVLTNKKYDKTINSQVGTTALIESTTFSDGWKEAEYVISKIESLLPSNESIAILYRSSEMMSAINKLLTEKNIPIAKIETKVVKDKDVQAFKNVLRLFVNDSNLSLISVIPFCGLFSSTSKKKILSITGLNFANSTLPILMKSGLTLNDAIMLFTLIKKINMMKSNIKTLTSSSQFIDLLKTFITDLKMSVTIPTSFVLNDNDDVMTQISLYIDDTSVEEPQIVSNQTNGVAVMTVHSAKGLEFDNVFLVGVEKGIYTDDDEDRRVLYVGMTRAKKALYITSTEERYVYGQLVKTGSYL